MKWIKHDTDANQDNKLQNVLLDYGLEGYGLYWYCLELIGSKVDKDNITFELEHDARVIARNVGSTAQKVEEMMRYFVRQGLFQEADNVITCLAMAKRLDKSMTSNAQMRQIIGDLALTQTVKEGYVYFIESIDDDGYAKEIKIGRSANPHARFKEHQKKYSEFGFELNLLGFIKSVDCVSLETEIHRKLKDKSVRKEWFSVDNEVLDLLRHDYGLTTSCKIRLDQTRLDQTRLDQTRSEKTIKENTSTKETIDKSGDLIFPTNVSKNAWDDWANYRKEIRKPLKASTIKQQLKFLSENKNGDEIIYQSIRNGWTGLFELKANSNQKPKHDINNLENQDYSLNGRF